MITGGAAPAPSGGAVADKWIDDNVESAAARLTDRGTDIYYIIHSELCIKDEG